METPLAFDHSMSPSGRYPVPPEDLRWRVTSNRVERAFLVSGERTAREIDGFLRAQVGRSLRDFGNILDFGCGCGRVVRHLRDHTAANIHGCDIDPQAIQWCSANILDGNFFVDGEYPPLEVGTRRFELIYALSVFTHIDEDHQFKWLDELRRVSAPGGVLFLTFRDDQIVAGFPDGAVKRRVSDGLSRKGMSYVVNRGWAGVFPEWYGGAYHTFDYVRNSWGRYFEILALSRPLGAVSQCVALLRNRAQT